MIGLLITKIVSLCICIALGFVVVRKGLAPVSITKSLSNIVIYIVLPCSILNSFDMDYTPEVMQGLLLCAGCALIVHVLWILLAKVLKGPLHLDAVEHMSVVYANCGNMVIPIVASVFGQEYVIYACAFMVVQIFFLWSHGLSLISGKTTVDVKKIFTNINIIAAIVGIILFLLHIRLPGFAAETVSSMGGMLGPMSMLITGMILGDMDLSELKIYKRLPLIIVLRLLVFPAVILVLWKWGPFIGMHEDGSTLMLISLLGCLGPSASLCTQLALLYDNDAKYASAINIATTLLCVITMPLLSGIFSM